MPHRYTIRKGLDINILGAPSQSIEDGPEISCVSLNGLDYKGLKPRLAVSVGDRVTPGQPLFTDRKNPAALFVSPAGGVVRAINRGARRVLETIEVELDGSQEPPVDFPVCSEEEIAQLSRQKLCEILQRAGLWSAFRTRPYDKVPLAESSPAAIFVNAMDSRPLAPEPAVILAGHEEAFCQGLQAISRLSDGMTWFCTAPDWPLFVPDIPGLDHAEFDGPHPSGLPGTHIHFLHPVGAGHSVWHIGYQDVLAVGELLLNGSISRRRVVALGGPLVKKPRLLTTITGASIRDLVVDELVESSHQRVISGSVLGGRNAAGHNQYLGRYHNQVSVLQEGGRRKFLGWSGHLKAKRQVDTSRHGRFSGMLPVRAFDRIMPLDILPSPLFRALLVMDTDQAQALGCLELAEEDLALCMYACPAKSDFSGALRANLDHIEKHG